MNSLGCACDFALYRYLREIFEQIDLRNFISYNALTAYLIIEQCRLIKKKHTLLL